MLVAITGTNVYVCVDVHYICFCICMYIFLSITCSACIVTYVIVLRTDNLLCFSLRKTINFSYSQNFLVVFRSGLSLVSFPLFILLCLLLLLLFISGLLQSHFPVPTKPVYYCQLLYPSLPRHKPEKMNWIKSCKLYFLHVLLPWLHSPSITFEMAHFCTPEFCITHQTGGLPATGKNWDINCQWLSEKYQMWMV